MIKFLYKLAGCVIWGLGCVAFVRGLQLGHWHDDGLKAITIGGFLVVSFFSIFSFLYGAQAGHVVRFVLLVLSALLGVMVYVNELKLITGPAYQALFYALAGTIVVIALKVRARFHDEYRREGKVDYFERYFG